MLPECSTDYWCAFAWPWCLEVSQYPVIRIRAIHSIFGADISSWDNILSCSKKGWHPWLFRVYLVADQSWKLHTAGAFGALSNHFCQNGLWSDLSCKIVFKILCCSYWKIALVVSINQLVQWAHAATKSQRFFSTGSSSTSSSWFSSWTWSLCNFRDNFQRRTDLQSTKLETERRLSIQKSIPARAWAKMATESKSPKKKSIAFHEFFKPKLQKKGISSSNAVTSASFWQCFVLNFQKVRHPHVKQQTHPVTRNETRLTNLAAL